MLGMVLQTDLASDSTEAFGDTGAVYEAGVLALLSDGGLLAGSAADNGNIHRFAADGALVETYASGLGQIGGIATIPEPGTIWLVVGGLVGWLLWRRAARANGGAARR
jgi:hypothetical protein